MPKFLISYDEGKNEMILFKEGQPMVSYSLKYRHIELRSDPSAWSAEEYLMMKEKMTELDDLVEIPDLGDLVVEYFKDN